MARMDGGSTELGQRERGAVNVGTVREEVLAKCEKLSNTMQAERF